MTVDPSGTHIERIYEVATTGDLSQIDVSLGSLPRISRMSDPTALALRSMKAIFTGNVPSGIALLEKALELPRSTMTPYIVDLLVPLYVSGLNIDAAESLLDTYEDMAFGALVPMFLSARAVVSARRGNDVDSRAFAKQCLQLGRALENPIFSARVLSRVALSAFYREDFDEAQDRALESARMHEQIGAFRGALAAYSVLFVIAHTWLGDPDVARFYAERMAICAMKCGDQSMLNYGLVVQLEIAAEAGDQRRFGSLKTRLLENPIGEQYRERFGYVLANVLADSWSGRFDQAILAIDSLRKSEGRGNSEKALCYAVSSALNLALGRTDESKRNARISISMSSTGGAGEARFETRNRRIARIVASAVCILGGESTRGRRALSRSFDPDHRFADIISRDGMREAETPALMRGYARLINSVAAASKASFSDHGLTPSELEVLRVLPDGETLATIAQGMKKSRKTIERQVGSIYQKLQVSNRAQAIRRARDLGIHA